MLTYYFAYGADMDSVELDLQHDRRRRPRMRFAKSTPASLPGYRLTCDISSKARYGGIFNIVPDPKSSVEGVIYTLHPGDTVSVAAMKEGDVAKYALSLLPVTTAKGENLSALVLHAQPVKKQLQPSLGYLDIVIRAARHHGLSPNWLEHLQSIRTRLISSS